MSLLKRIEKVEKKVFGDNDRKVTIAMASPRGFMCTGANVSTWAEFDAYVERTYKKGGYGLFYHMEFIGRDIEPGQFKD